MYKKEKKLMSIKFIPFVILIVSTLLTQIVVGQNNKGFTLSCQFKGLPDKSNVYLLTIEKDTVDKAVSNGEQFLFSGVLPQNGRFLFIKMDTAVSKVNTNAFFVLNNKIEISGEIGKKTINVIGSSAHNDFMEFTDVLAKAQAEQNKILRDLKEAESKISISSIDSNVAKKKHDELLKKRELQSNYYKQSGLEWIASHKNSLYTPYAIIAFRSLLNIDEMQKSYNELKLEVKNSYYGNQLKNVIEIAKFSLTIYEGANIPNFPITTLDGKKVFINDIAARSKITLIDCWASWCAPCRAAVPNLKSLYSEYSDKGFNIVGISSDKIEANWKKAVLEDKTPWFQGIQVGEKKVIDIFNIKFIPAYILIDNKGKLIAFDCPASMIKQFGGSLRGEELEKKIASLLDK